MTRFMLGLIALLLALMIGQIATAHGWYSPWCCSGEDCAPIPFEAVTETREGYIVELHPGEHPIASGIFFIPHGSPNIHQSQDGFYHACILPPSFDGASLPDTVLRCLYVPFSA